MSQHNPLNQADYTAELIRSAVRLASVLEGENHALAHMDLTRAVTLLEEKTAALDSFNATRVLATSTNAIKGMDRKTIEGLSQNLDQLLEENRTLLERAMRAQGRVIGMIAKAARRTQPIQRYGNKGTMTRPVNTRPMALSSSV